MAKIRVAISKVISNLPVGNSAFDNTAVLVRDSAGTTSEAVLGGPWEADFQVSDGPGTVTVTDMDDSGNPIGTPVTVSYDASAPQVKTYPATAGVSIVVLP